VAIALPSLVAFGFGLSGVEIVKDVGDIPRGVPRPALPELSAINADLLTAAPAIAAIIVVQGSGVSQTVPNPDGSRRRMSWESPTGRRACFEAYRWAPHWQRQR
jgi:SulP family sulfate permease